MVPFHDALIGRPPRLHVSIAPARFHVFCPFPEPHPNWTDPSALLQSEPDTLMRTAQGHRQVSRSQGKANRRPASPWVAVRRVMAPRDIGERASIGVWRRRVLCQL
jgi:hypothetical protein